MTYASNKGHGCRRPVLELCPAASSSFTGSGGYTYPPAAPAAGGSQAPTTTPSDASPSENLYVQADDGVGSWGGWCTCPDGQRYNVGDQFDGCANGPASLACFGGTAGECVQTHDASRAGMMVTCAPAAPEASITTTLSRDTSHFEPVDGGNDRACRGSSRSDNSASYYTVEQAASLDDCKAQCTSRPECRGIELCGRRCELWTREAGIGASKYAPGFTCLRISDGAPSTTSANSLLFQPVDGPDRACRGADQSDNSGSYFQLFPGTASLEACQARCAAMPECKGIEYAAGHNGRCEVWTRSAGIQATVRVSGFQCLRFVPTGAA
jgi:hypothetical protein